MSFFIEKNYAYADGEFHVLIVIYYRTMYYPPAQRGIKYDVISQGVRESKLTFHSVPSIVSAIINQDEINGRWQSKRKKNCDLISRIYIGQRLRLEKSKKRVLCIPCSEPFAKWSQLNVTRRLHNEQVT